MQKKKKMRRVLRGVPRRGLPLYWRVVSPSLSNAQVPLVKRKTQLDQTVST